MDVTELPAARVADDAREAFARRLQAALDDAYRRAAVLLASRLEAEDAVHDAAERAWRARRSLRSAEQFDAWFARILLNVCRDRLRRRRRVAAVEIRDAPGDVDDGMTSRLLGRVDERARIVDALSILSADERIAVVLRFEGDMTVPDIARITATREGTIKARLHHALRKLREHLGEDDEQ